MELSQRCDFFTSVEIDAAKKLAVKIDPSQLQTALPPAASHITGIEFSPQFLPPVMKERSFCGCTFEQVSFHGSNAAQVTMNECRLRECYIANANFRESDFTGSYLNFNASSSSFDSSDFTKTTLFSVNLEGCSFSESYFYNAQILNSNAIHSEFVATKFSKTYLEDLDISKSNLDYAEFEQIEFTNVTLPYWGILHVVKGLWEILSTDKVIFSTPDRMHCVGKNQYIEEALLLRPFFYQKMDFLALANLYVFSGEYEKAYDIILLGISDTCKRGNLKQLKYLCRMASHNRFFSRAQLRKLYQQIELSISSVSFSPMQYKNYLRELDTAKRLLLDQPFERDTIFITIQTTIDSKDYDKCLRIQKMLDHMLLEAAPEAISHIEVRHNSPLEFVIQISETICQLVAFFALVDFAFDKSTTYIERVQNIILNHKKLSQNTESSHKMDQLEKQLGEIQHKVEKLETQALGKNLLVLPGSEEFRRVSYTLYTKDSIPRELRTYSVSR